MPSTKHVLTLESRSRILEALKSGWSYDKISELLEIPRSAIEGVKISDLHKEAMSNTVLVMPAHEHQNKCSKCGLIDRDSIREYSESLDMYFCQKCLSTLTIGDMKMLGGKNMNTVTKELFA